MSQGVPVRWLRAAEALTWLARTKRSAYISRDTYRYGNWPTHARTPLNVSRHLRSHMTCSLTHAARTRRAARARAARPSHVLCACRYQSQAELPQKPDGDEAGGLNTLRSFTTALGSTALESNGIALAVASLGGDGTFFRAKSNANASTHRFSLVNATRTRRTTPLRGTRRVSLHSFSLALARARARAPR